MCGCTCLTACLMLVKRRCLALHHDEEEEEDVLMVHLLILITEEQKRLLSQRGWHTTPLSTLIYLKIHYLLLPFDILDYHIVPELKMVPAEDEEKVDQLLKYTRGV